MKAILGDITALYALLDPDDQYHQQAQADLQRINEAKLSVIISYPIYLETYRLILQRLGVQQAIKFALEIKQSATLVNPQGIDYQVAAKNIIPGFPDPTMTTFDAVTAILSRQMKVSVWTYNQNFYIMSIAVWGAKIDNANE